MLPLLVQVVVVLVIAGVIVWAVRSLVVGLVAQTWAIFGKIGESRAYLVNFGSNSMPKSPSCTGGR